MVTKHMKLFSKRNNKNKIGKNNLLSGLTALTFAFITTACQLNNVAVTEAPLTSQDKEHFLIGNMSANDNGGVSLLSFTPSKNEFINEGIIAETKLASYLALNKDHSSLFTVIADKNGGVHRFKWDAIQQKYTLQQTITVAGRGSCHVALNKDESQLVIANYSSGDVHLYNIDKDTQHLTEIGYFKNTPNDDLKIHQKPRMHYTNWDNNGQYLYAVDLGTDEIKVFNSKDTSFTPQVAAVLENGDGPRHLTFHPETNIIYVLNEFSSVIVAYQQNAKTGKLKKIQRLTALPEGITSKNSASAIRISPDGKYLYAGIRGINAISVFAINNNGKLNMIQSHSSLGNWPRDLNFSKNGDYLLVANKRENMVNILARDKKTGLLSPTTLEVAVEQASLITSFNINK